MNAEIRIAETSRPCCQSNCGGRASRSFVWPGRPRALICDEHYGKLLKVAAAIGLSWESLDVDIVTDSQALTGR